MSWRDSLFFLVIAAPFAALAAFAAWLVHGTQWPLWATLPLAIVASIGASGVIIFGGSFVLITLDRWGLNGRRTWWTCGTIIAVAAVSAIVVSQQRAEDTCARHRCSVAGMHPAIVFRVGCMCVADLVKP